MRSKNWTVAFFLAGALCATGAIFSSGPAMAQQASEQSQAPGVAAATEVTSSQLKAMLEQKDFFFVNVHIPYEGEIEKTDAFIAYDKISENLGQLPKDKNAKIVVYCRSGRMSAVAAQELLRLGYTRVSDLKGGMIDWARNGYQIIVK